MLLEGGIGMTIKIPLNHGKTALIDDEDYEKVSHRKWQYSKGYAVSGSYLPKNHLRMHRVILGLSHNDHQSVDHINGDRLDNRKTNLRLCTNSQNQANRDAPTTNTSGYKGVTYHRGKKAWMASANHNNKAYFAGYHQTPELAAKAYDELAKKLWGDFAKLNFHE